MLLCRDGWWRLWSNLRAAGFEYKNATEAGSLRILLVNRWLSKQSRASTIPRDDSVLGFDLRSNNATMNSGKKILLLLSVSAESVLSDAMSL